MADSFYKDAEKKLKGGLFSAFTGKDYEGAQDLFAKAGARYKIDKDYARSGEAYMRAGDCAIKTGDDFAAAQLYADSANAYKKIDAKKAGEMVQMASQIQIGHNRLGHAARLIKEYADALDEQGSSLDAIPHYETAMQYFDAEDQKAQSQNCMLAMARIYGDADDFDKSLMYYERVANNMLGGPLKFQAAQYFFRAMLCRFAMVTNDNRFEKSEECQEALERYMVADMYMKGTRETETLQLLLESLTDCDVDKFERGISLLQDIRKLDEWNTHVLLVVKQNMESLT